MTPITNPTRKPQIIWEKLPEDFILPDEPAESSEQEVAKLREILGKAGISEEEEVN